METIDARIELDLLQAELFDLINAKVAAFEEKTTLKVVSVDARMIDVDIIGCRKRKMLSAVWVGVML